MRMDLSRTAQLLGVKGSFYFGEAHFLISFVTEANEANAKGIDMFSTHFCWLFC